MEECIILSSKEVLKRLLETKWSFLKVQLCQKCFFAAYVTKGWFRSGGMFKNHHFKFSYFSYNVTLKDMHDKMHSNEETFMCLQCNRKFTDAEHLELHLRAHNDARVVSFLSCYGHLWTWNCFSNSFSFSRYKRKLSCATFVFHMPVNIAAKNLQDHTKKWNTSGFTPVKRYLSHISSCDNLIVTLIFIAIFMWSLW